MARRARQSERAYEAIRRRILGRAIEPGARLTEQAYAAELGVNRGDIRQALARLDAAGLVVRGDKGGFFVPRLSPAQISQLLEARMVLEAAAVRLAVRRASKTDLDALRKICRDMDQMARKGYRLGVYEADLRFHERLVRSAHNEKITQIYQMANLPLSDRRPIDPPREIDRLREEVEKHEKILAALVRRDENRVIQLLNRGVRESNVRI